LPELKNLSMKKTKIDLEPQNKPFISIVKLDISFVMC
jgi:hypothetical protein